jgi:hypothetical protein
MEREQLLKVMVPVGGFALLLVVVGAIIALANGGPPPSSKPADTGGAEFLKMEEVGTVPLDSALTKELPPLDAPEWKPFPNEPGMKVWDVKEGTEDYAAQNGGRVKVHYIGWRTDGYSFDSSLKHGGPYECSLGAMIRGWQSGIPGMKVGGIRRLYIPARLGYGSQDKGRDIPPNSDLVFEVQLVRVFVPKK